MEAGKREEGGARVKKERGEGCVGQGEAKERCWWRVAQRGRGAPTEVQGGVAIVVGGLGIGPGIQ